MSVAPPVTLQGHEVGGTQCELYRWLIGAVGRDTMILNVNRLSILPAKSMYRTIVRNGTGSILLITMLVHMNAQFDIFAVQTCPWTYIQKLPHAML